MKIYHISQDKSAGVSSISTSSPVTSPISTISPMSITENSDVSSSDGEDIPTPILPYDLSKYVDIPTRLKKKKKKKSKK